MRFLIAFVLTALLSFSWALFFPWWIIAVAAFIVAALIPQARLRAFICGFLSLFLLWGGQCVLIDTANGHLLSHKVAEILPFGGSSVAIIVFTAFLGGLIGGLGALTGSFLRTPPIEVKKQS